MIGPIMPTGAGPTQPFGVIGQSSLGANLLSNLGSTQGSPASGRVRSAEGSNALLRLQESLTALVDELGLDARSEELLHLLIGLIILMALLNGTQNGAGGQGGQGSGELPSSASGARGGASAEDGPRIRRTKAPRPDAPRIFPRKR